MPTVPDLPWESEVSDTDPCQPVKEQETGDAVLVKCKGSCRRGQRCVQLQRRRTGSDRPWQDIEDLEPVGAKDTSHEYRCKCIP